MLISRQILDKRQFVAIHVVACDVDTKILEEKLFS